MPPTNKTTPSRMEGINMENIFQTLQTWETKNMTKFDDEGGEIQEQQEQPQDYKELVEQQLN